MSAADREAGVGGRDGRNAPTLESVAARAGVSRATAGRVLAGSARVSDHARDAVLQAAAELSYVTNRAARSLMTRRSDSIAFVVAEQEERFFADPFFSLVLRGVHAAVAARDVQVVFAVLASDAERERFERFVRGGHVDGVVFVSLHGADPLPQRLQDAGVPVLLQGRPLDIPRGAPASVAYVDADNHQGARAATGLLAGAGRRRIGTVTGPLDMAAAVDRYDGFRAELSDLGLRPAAVAHGDFSVDGGRRAMAALLDAAPDLDAVVVANDLMALGALQTLGERGRRVPDDVALVGFDDIPIAAATTPPLTTVRQPMDGMGRAMAEALLEMVDDHRHRGPLILPTEIVRRASA
jgi:DNA-binding LacI/PurR family transcriptional regulator